jgi:hypothetical protein
MPTLWEWRVYEQYDAPCWMQGSQFARKSASKGVSSGMWDSVDALQGAQAQRKAAGVKLAAQACECAAL